MLIDQIYTAKNGSDEDFLILINRFRGLFSKYGRRLGYEDATYDLMADFVELIRTCDFEKLTNTSDGAIVNYIATSCYRHYLHRLHTIVDLSPPMVLMDDLSFTQRKQLEEKASIENTFQVSVLFPQDVLTKREIQILLAIYEKGLSVADIASALHVSRQNINQIRKRAEKKLQEYLK